MRACSFEIRYVVEMGGTCAPANDIGGDWQAEKAELMKLLAAESLCPPGVPQTPPVAAIHALIARTPSLLALAQADDLAGEMHGVNLPGTDRERPNWRRRLHCDAAAFANHPVLAAMRAERKAIPAFENSANA